MLQIINDRRNPNEASEFMKSNELFSLSIAMLPPLDFFRLFALLLWWPRICRSRIQALVEPGWPRFSQRLPPASPCAAHCYVSAPKSWNLGAETPSQENWTMTGESVVLSSIMTFPSGPVILSLKLPGPPLLAYMARKA